MSVTPKRAINAAQLTNAAVTYYTAPANVRAIIKKLTFLNSTATARTVTVHIVPAAGAAAASNMLVSARTVGPGETYECFEAQGHVLNTGDFLQALSDAAAAVTIHGSVAEVTM